MNHEIGTMREQRGPAQKLCKSRPCPSAPYPRNRSFLEAERGHDVGTSDGRRPAEPMKAESNRGEGRYSGMWLGRGQAGWRADTGCHELAMARRGSKAGRTAGPLRRRQQMYGIATVHQAVR
jgi:hypothetical protein